MSTYDLVEKAKRIQKVDSDNKFADVIGVTRANISHWKSGRSQPDGLTMLKLAELAGLSAHDALVLVTRPAANDDAPMIQNSDMVYIMLNWFRKKVRAFEGLDYPKVFVLR